MLIVKNAIKWTLILCISLGVLALPSSSDVDAFFTEQLYNQVKDEYGDKASKLTKAWYEVIKDNRDEDNWRKINSANNFFNKHITYKRDHEHWKKKDYWATPIESIGTGAGDCEDYAIAKYFTLKAMGVDESKLRMMYVKALKWNEPHMVLIYTKDVKSIPLVLDNMNPKVLPANKRRDLKPVYSFNAEGLWLAKAQGLGKKLRNSSNNSKWENLMRRIEHGK